jgi:hypothetical protein
MPTEQSTCRVQPSVVFRPQLLVTTNWPHCLSQAPRIRPYFFLPQSNLPLSIQLLSLHSFYIWALEAFDLLPRPSPPRSSTLNPRVLLAAWSSNEPATDLYFENTGKFVSYVCAAKFSTPDETIMSRPLTLPTHIVSPFQPEGLLNILNGRAQSRVYRA